MSIHKRLRGLISKTLKRRINKLDLRLVQCAIRESFYYCPECKGARSYLGENMGVCCCGHCGGDGNGYGDVEINGFYLLDCEVDEVCDYVKKHWKRGKSEVNQSTELIWFLIKFIGYDRNECA